MLKFTGVAKAGQTIRAYDFKPMVGRNDCFVEGTVLDDDYEGVGYRAFKIRCTKDVFDGQENPEGKGSRVSKIVFVPHEVSFMEYDARIINQSI